VKPASEAGLPLLLKSLCLPTFAREYAAVAVQAVRGGLSHEGYLLALAEQEASERSERRVERLLQESKLPREKSLACFDVGRLPPKARAALAGLQDGSFLDQATNLIVFGNPGTGKSHLVCGLGQELVRGGGRTVLFSPTYQIVQRLLCAKRDLRLAAELRRLDRFEALILDDLGYVEQSREEMEVLFTLIAERYERRSVLITSNLVFSKWDQIFKDPMTTAAAVDRIVHHSVILELSIESYRAQAAKQRAAGPRGVSSGG
jgi:DNA replication protein DnaC